MPIDRRRQLSPMFEALKDRLINGGPNKAIMSARRTLCKQTKLYMNSIRGIEQFSMQRFRDIYIETHTLNPHIKRE